MTRLEETSQLGDHVQSIVRFLFVICSVGSCGWDYFPGHLQ